MIFWIKNRVIKNVSIAVIAIHIIGLILATSSTKDKPAMKKQKLIVKTMQISPQTQIKQASTVKKTIPSLPAQVKKQETPSTPKKPEIKATPKKIQPVAKPKLVQEKKPEIKPIKKQTPQIEINKTKNKEIHKSLKDIKETIAKIEAENARIVNSPQSKILESAEEAILPDDYPSSLIYCLQNNLQLPDIGEVKIQLTLFSNGKVEKMTVLSAESETNKKRLEETLMNLQFPSFPKEKRGLQKQTFILTFCNEL